ncbi:MAG TPA: LPD38 domain-containing protein [Bacillota bacterium]
MDVVDSGRISAADAAKIEALNKDYVPFKRVFEDALNLGQKAGGPKGFADLPKAIHSITGSSREIIDPLESTVKDIYLFTKLADNNRAGRALADLADKTEGGGWWLSRVDDLGKAPSKENVLTTYRDGQPVHYQVRDPDLYQAVLSLDEKGADTIVKILSYPASLLRAGATLSPDFIVRNPIRDQLSALIYSKYGFVPGVDLVKGIMHAVNQDELYQLYLESGAGHSALVSLDREYLQGTLRKLLENKNAFVNAFRHPVQTLQEISELMEVGTRLGEFERALAKEGTSREGLMKAALAARDITVDFARKGTKMGTWNRLVAFSNASVQGMDKMRRAFLENPAGTTVKATLAITLPSMLLWMVNKDDPFYDELPSWRKDLFWNIPAGTKDVKQKDGSIVKATRFISIPKPFELGVIFGTIPERTLTWLKEKDPKAMDGLAKTLFDAGTPGFIPTAAVWAIEAWANRDLRTGVSIVPEGETGLEAWRQYGAATSETAKLIGKATNLSPRKIDNTIREVLGGLGKYGVDLADAGLVAAGVAKPVAKPARTLSEIPIAKAFAVETPQTSSASIDRFYREADALEKKYQTSKKGGTKLRREEGTRLSRLRDYRQALSDLRQLRSKVEFSKTMTPQQKRAEIDRINLAMTNLARKALGEETIK